MLLAWAAAKPLRMSTETTRKAFRNMDFPPEANSMFNQPGKGVKVR